MKSKLEITPQTIVADLLKAYPELEDKLIEIAPVFVKLKNPILKKTIAKVTTLKQASVVGGVSLGDLINKLRNEVSQTGMKIDDEAVQKKSKPNWVEENKTKIEYDASTDLEQGRHPVAKVTKEVNDLSEGENYLLITPFIPSPLIKIIEEKGFKTYTEKQNENSFYSYISKI